jgi:protein-disulfide isomerase
MTSMRKLTLFALITLLADFGLRAQNSSPSEEALLGGSLDAPIRIDLFSDYQCPVCRNLYLETIRPVLKDYSEANKVCIVYHDFPLKGHQYAREAARYSQAALRVGRRQWLAVVDALYTNQPAWSQDGKIEAAITAAVSPEDLQKIKKLLTYPYINEAIDRDIALGQNRKVESTPTLFVNAVGREQKVVGVIPYPVLRDFFNRIVK